MDSLLKQLNLKHFIFALAMGDDDVFVYEWGTINGLMRVNEEYGLIEVIAIANDVQHNGQFVKFIEMLEKYQDDEIIIFSVTEFFNSRLRDWFIRRGYIHEVESDSVFYKELPLTQRNVVDTIKT